MFKRTFETIAKHFASQYNVDICYDTESGAHANMKDNTIHLPKAISDENSYAALALTMHEAAHLHYSKVIPMEDVVTSDIDHTILNFIEDLRIDYKNMHKYPNVKSFYEKLVEKQKDLTKKPEPISILCESYLRLLGLGDGIKTINKKNKIKTMNGLVSKGYHNIEKRNWEELKETIQEIKSFLKIPPEQENPVTNATQAGESSGTKLEKGINDVLKPQGCVGAGQKDMKGGSVAGINPASLKEQTKNQFKELLNIKESKKTSEGMSLDLDNLTSFHTRDITDLFEDVKIIKKKKSKIFFLLDASGSMWTRLLDGTYRCKTLVSCVKSLITILDEVREVEGMNIDWEVGSFQTSFMKLPKESWEMNYNVDGGTCLFGPLVECCEHMDKDYTVEGKKILVVFTDGDIEDKEVIQIQEYLQNKPTDIRLLFIGVGTTDEKLKNILGDNVILESDSSDHILCKAIEELL